MSWTIDHRGSSRTRTMTEFLRPLLTGQFILSNHVCCHLCQFALRDIKIKKSGWDGFSNLCWSFLCKSDVVTSMVAWKQLALSQTCAVVQWYYFIGTNSFLINILPIDGLLQLQDTALMQVLRNPALRQGYNLYVRDQIHLRRVRRY